MRQIRSALYSAYFTIVTVTALVFGVPLTLFSRRLLMQYAANWGQMVHAGLRICGIRVVIEGLENLPPPGPMLIASQHQSAFETMLWFRLVPDCRYVMKAELMRVPLFGWLCRRVGQISVERGMGAQAMRGLLTDAGQVVIFPEGTRAKPGVPVELKAGFAVLASMSRLPVIPVTTDSGICWGKGMLGKHPGTIHVRIHPPLPVGMPREQMMREVKRLYDESTLARGVVEKPVDNSVH